MSLKSDNQRISFSSVKNRMHYPDFLEVQLKSFQDFFQLDTTAENRKNEGLYKVFMENFPITDTRNNFVLEFIDYYVDKMNEAEKAATRELQNRNLRNAMARPADLLVLDEAGSAWELDMVDKALLQKAVRERPAARECVLTAHQPPQWMLDEADYVTEMKCHRHPYQKGVPARKGIEY